MYKRQLQCYAAESIFAGGANYCGFPLLRRCDAQKPWAGAGGYEGLPDKSNIIWENWKAAVKTQRLFLCQTQKAGWSEVFLLGKPYIFVWFFDKTGGLFVVVKRKPKI